MTSSLGARRRPVHLDSRKYFTPSKRHRDILFGWKPTRTWFISLILLMGFVSGCGGASSSPPPPSDNPVPNIASLSPSSATVAAQAQTLTIQGSNFLFNSTVTYNGQPHTPTFMSSAQLSISLSASDQATAGDFSVIVSNPTPGGGASNTANFVVDNPLPIIGTVSPSVIAVGTPALTIAVTGTNFVATSKVNLDGVALTTTAVSSTQVTASIPAASFANAGTQTILVSNPGPGGGASNSQPLTVLAVGAVSLFSVPASSGGTAGPWQLRAAVIDPQGNPIPNLFLTFQTSSGALSAAQGTTDAFGSFSATISPPVNAGSASATAINVAAGNHIAVVNLTFVNFPAAASVKRPRSDIQQSGPSSNFIQEPFEFGVSTKPADPGDPFLNPDPCYTPFDLVNDTTIKCAPIYANNHISSTPSNFATESCQTISAISTLVGLANCAGALATVAVCLDTPAAIICAGELGFLADPSIACLTFIAGEIAQHFQNQTAIQVIDAAGIVEDPTDPLGVAGVVCDALQATSSSGPRIYITNSGNGTVSVFDENGVLVPTQSNFPGLVAPDGIAYDASTQQLYITDVGNDTIKVYTLEGQLVESGTAFPTTPGGNPEDIIFDPLNRRFYVNDTNFNAIFVYSETGNPVILPAGAFSGLSGPFGIGFNHTTTSIYVSNSNTNQVLVFDQNGMSKNLQFGGLFLPDDIAWDPATGNIYVVNDGNSSVTVFDPNGNIVPIPGGFQNLNHPDQIVGDGNFLSPKFYITNIQGNSLKVFNRTGNDITPINGFQNLNQPTGVVVVP